MIRTTLKTVIEGLSSFNLLMSLTDEDGQPVYAPDGRPMPRTFRPLMSKRLNLVVKAIDPLVKEFNAKRDDIIAFNTRDEDGTPVHDEPAIKTGIDELLAAELALATVSRIPLADFEAEGLKFTPADIGHLDWMIKYDVVFEQESE